MKRAIVVSICAVLGLSGCAFAWRALERNFEVPHTPRAIAHKIHNPKRSDARLAALWVGHATVLVQLDDIFVLTDPVLTRTVGELSPRLVEPGLDAQDVPPLAAVVVSHMHFDHLSFGSLEMLEEKTPMLLVPPGVRSILPRFKFESRELGIWQSYESRGLRITAVPVRHVGGRYGIDQGWNRLAFTGYVLEYNGLTVYFGGDTAFDAVNFSATEQHFTAIDLALLPICPNKPRDFMRRTHMDPSEALDAFELLAAKRMVPIHFDTFINSDDAPGDCPKLLRQLTHARRLDEKVAILEIGEQRVFIGK